MIEGRVGIRTQRCLLNLSFTKVKIQMFTYQSLTQTLVYIHRAFTTSIVVLL